MIICATWTKDILEIFNKISSSNVKNLKIFCTLLKKNVSLNCIVCAIPLKFMSTQIVTAPQSRDLHNLQTVAGK